MKNIDLLMNTPEVPRNKPVTLLAIAGALMGLLYIVVFPLAGVLAFAVAVYRCVVHSMGIKKTHPVPYRTR